MGPPNILQVFVKKGYSRYKSSNTLAAHCFPRPPLPTPIDRISRRSHHSKKYSFFFPNLILANQITLIYGFLLDFPRNSDSKESACCAGAQVQSLDWEDPLEEGMATHSSILVWRIPWTEEPGRLQSIGLQRVRHD